jgi:hypothetical protein
MRGAAQASGRLWTARLGKWVAGRDDPGGGDDDEGCDSVLTGHCGPNAFRALQAAGIRVYAGVTGGSVREAVEQFKAGALREAAAADVQGHW